MRLLGLSLLLLGCGCAAAGKAPPREPIHLTVVATNDVHGWIERGPDGVGGVDLLAGTVEIARAQGPVVLVDAGDMWQGTLASNVTEGAAVVDLYNALGYDAAALGNHEFDFGPPGDRMTAKFPGDDPLGALKARAAEAHFPLLAANVVRADGSVPPWMKAGVLIERDGVRVGIVGMATPDTPQVTVGANVRELRFLDPVPAAIAEGKRLRAAGAEVLVLLAHMGGTCLEDGCEGALLDLLRALPPGLYDAAIGGHTHRVVQAEVNGIPLIESGALGRAFGTVDLALDPGTHRVIAKESAAGIEIRDGLFRGKQVQADPAVAARLAPWVERVAEVKARSLGARLPKRLTLDYDGESDVGNLVAEAMLSLVPEADLAVTNSGGLRAELPEGEVRYGDVFETLPFNNGLAVIETDGVGLRELIRAGFAGVHGGLQLAGGSAVVDQGRCAEADLDGDGAITPLDRDRLLSLQVHGKPIDPKGRYRVVTNDFLAGGGGGWDKVLARLAPGSVRVRDDLPLQREALVQWLRGRGEVMVPARGRVELRGVAPVCPAGR